jgi:hypothetical protein
VTLTPQAFPHLGHLCGRSGLAHRRLVAFSNSSTVAAVATRPTPVVVLSFALSAASSRCCSSSCSKRSHSTVYSARVAMRRSEADETPSNQTVGYAYTRHETMPKDTPALELMNVNSLSGKMRRVGSDGGRGGKVRCRRTTRDARLRFNRDL